MIDTQTREALHRLPIDYSYDLDTRDVDGLLSIFAEDGEFDQTPTSTALVTKGHQALRVMLQAVVDNFASTIHFATNHSFFDVEADQRAERAITGAPLARTEAIAAVEAFVGRVPNYRIHGDKIVPYPSAWTTNGFLSIPAEVA